MGFVVMWDEDGNKIMVEVEDKSEVVMRWKFIGRIINFRNHLIKPEVGHMQGGTSSVR